LAGYHGMQSAKPKKYLGIYGSSVVIILLYIVLRAIPSVNNIALPNYLCDIQRADPSHVIYYYNNMTVVVPSWSSSFFFYTQAYIGVADCFRRFFNIYIRLRYYYWSVCIQQCHILCIRTVNRPRSDLYSYPNSRSIGIQIMMLYYIAIYFSNNKKYYLRKLMSRFLENITTVDSNS